MALNTYCRYTSLTCFLLFINYNISFSYLSYIPIRNKPLTNHYTKSFLQPLSSSLLEEILADEEIQEEIKPDLETLSINEIKLLLLSMLQKSTIMKKDLNYISDLVNVLERKYVPVQTLEFLNFAMGGEWELLFSTNQLGMPQRQLMLGTLHQNVETSDDSGLTTNTASWEYSEQLQNSTYITSKGIFKIQASYTFQSTGRMIHKLKNHMVKPIGYTIPSDVPKLVSLLYKSIPLELFDPNNLGMDITFMDEKIKIVRISSAQNDDDKISLDGVRNIFVRK